MIIHIGRPCSLASCCVTFWLRCLTPGEGKLLQVGCKAASRLQPIAAVTSFLVAGPGSGRLCFFFTLVASTSPMLFALSHAAAAHDPCWLVFSPCCPTSPSPLSRSHHHHVFPESSRANLKAPYGHPSSLPQGNTSHADTSQCC